MPTICPHLHKTGLTHPAHIPDGYGGFPLFLSNRFTTIRYRREHPLPFPGGSTLQRADVRPPSFLRGPEVPGRPSSDNDCLRKVPICFIIVPICLHCILTCLSCFPICLKFFRFCLQKVPICLKIVLDKRTSLNPSFNLFPMDWIGRRLYIMLQPWKNSICRPGRRGLGYDLQADQ